MRGAVLLLAAATVTGCRGDARAEASGDAGAADAGVRDAWRVVERRISRVLAEDPDLADDPIHVAVSGLLVTLSGSVDSRAEGDRAIDLARRHAEPQMMVYDGLRIVRPSKDR